MDPLSRDEFARFVAWIPSRGYAESTARSYATGARSALCRGLESADDVDRLMRNYPRRTRCFARCGLELLETFRGLPQ